MKPMLAYKIQPKVELGIIKFPLIASPKLDGVRALATKSDGFLTRRLKPHPNRFLQKAIWSPRIIGLDGEFILGDPTDDPYRRTYSATSTEEGEPQLTLWVFDNFLVGGPFTERFKEVQRVLKGRTGTTLEVVEHKVIKNLEELLDYEMKALKQGYEGIMTRKPAGGYKHGRSTRNEQLLMALKRREDSEARVVSMHPRMKNNNEAKINELGATSRSSHKANKVAQDTMGFMIVEDLKTSVRFELGAGKLTAAEAKAAWDEYNKDPAAFCAKHLAKYDFFPIGVKEKPRQPVLRGWRSPDDL